MTATVSSLGWPVMFHLRWSVSKKNWRLLPDSLLTHPEDGTSETALSIVSTSVCATRFVAHTPAAFFLRPVSVKDAALDSRMKSPPCPDRSTQRAAAESWIPSPAFSSPSQRPTRPSVT